MSSKSIFFSSVVAGFLATACNQTPDYKQVRDEVVEIHDSVMIDTENGYRNKRALDSLALQLDSLKKLKPELDTLQEKQAINALRSRLEDADNRMTDWMHQFEAEKGTKSDEEAIAYFKNEKSKIKTIDSLYNIVLKDAGDYLLKFRK